MSSAGDSNFDVGRVVSRTFSVIGRNWLVFLVLAVLAVIPETLFSVIFTQGAVAGGAGFVTSGSFWATAVAGWLVTIVLSFVLQAALTYGTIMDLNGQRASLGEALSVGFRAFLPLFAIGLLYSFGIALGFVLLLVPGLMLLTAWAVVVPARVAEHTSITESFSRSSDLTRGHRWAIFGIFVVFYIGLMILTFAVRPIFGLSMTSSTVVIAPFYLVVTGAIAVVRSVVSSAGIACIYYELRTAKEGIGPQQLASVFE